MPVFNNPELNRGDRLSRFASHILELWRQYGVSAEMAEMGAGLPFNYGGLEEIYGQKEREVAAELGFPTLADAWNEMTARTTGEYMYFRGPTSFEPVVHTWSPNGR